ncbi:MAG: putative transporter [Bacteroidales bacterium]|nr:putative transporter [Bacteroidales bacterium]
MDFLVDLFTSGGLASSLIYICLTGFVGSLLGKLRIAGIKLGIAGVLFTGITLGALGATVNKDMLHFAQEFGLILFVYAVGNSVGPRFFSSFRSDGLLLNVFAIAIVFLGFGIALAFHFFGGVDGAVITGVMCGAVTNTPGLGAAKQVISDMNAQGGIPIDDSVLGSGYAMAYPLGVVGIILTMILVRVFFRIKVEDESKAYRDSLNKGGQLESVVVTITNPNLVGKTVEFICNHFIDKEFTFSRVERGGEFLIPDAKFVINEGDIVHGVASSKSIDDLRLKFGNIEIGQKREVDGALAMKRFMVTNHKIAGKTVGQLGIYRRYPANITRIYRTGEELLPTLDTTLEVGDAVRVVGKKEVMNEIQREIGDSINEWSHPNIIALFMGITLGLILGAIPFAIPGLPMPAKLGLAGGPLLAAIILSWKGRIGGLSFYMNSGASMMLREMGICIFLGCVGLGAGGTFINTLVNGGYMWVLYGFIITLVPVMIVACVARMMKVNYLKICGFVAGSMTDPPALEFANGLSPLQAQSTAYATVYPLTMFLRILLGQTLILVTL